MKKVGLTNAWRGRDSSTPLRSVRNDMWGGFRTGWGRDRVLGRGLSWWDGSRGRGFFAMGGRQWREGEEGVREGVIRMKDGFSPPVFMGAGYSRGQRRGWGRDGSPHPRGQREGREGMGSRLHEGRLFAGMTEEGVREGVIRMKDGFSPPVLKGAGYSRE